MNKKNLVRNIVIFASLAAAGVGMVVLGQTSEISSVRGALPLLGSALFASGLTFFLVEMTRSVEA
jgi:hypothetical protein